MEYRTAAGTVTLTAPHRDLLAIACQVDNPAMPSALWDAVAEMGIEHNGIHPWVGALLYGVPLDNDPPLSTPEAMFKWQKKRRESIAFAQGYVHTWALKPEQWAKAVLAYLLFGGWDKPMRRRYGTRCPWPLVRASIQADDPQRQRAIERRRRAREYEQAMQGDVSTIARQYAGNGE